MLPPAVKNLLIINIIFFLATIVLKRYCGDNGRIITNMLALWPAESGIFRIWQPITYMFMHASLDHIFFNMFALWIFGYILENYWGTTKFLIYYFVCGIGAAITNLLVVHGYTPTVGASGAVYGILLAFGMMFPNERIYLYFFVPIKGKWFVIGYAAIELFEGMTRNDGIAHFAHLGGMLFGLILILLWPKRNIRPVRRPYDNDDEEW